MSNETEREAFEAAFRKACQEGVEPDFEQFGYKYMDADTLAAHKAFQAGAAYQREQDKNMVEALENLCSCIMETRGPNADKALFDANEALTAYRAQQEGK